MKRIPLLLFLLVVTVCMARANDIVVIGQVMSAVDGQPLESANVWFKNTEIGTTTNKDGFFMIRSAVPQKELQVSVVGYKKRSIQLDYGKDQMVEVYLREDVNLLDEILVMPGENPANDMIRQIIAHRDENNPELMTGIQYEKFTSSTIDLTTQKYKVQQRKLLKDLMRGNISTYDSTLILPVYASQMLDSVVKRSGEVYKQNLFVKQKAFQMLTVEQWNSYLNNYVVDANFYNNYLSLFDKTFVSPISVQALNFYNYLLTDSLEIGGGKLYEITFYPKNDKELVFRGKMLVDNVRHALVRIEASMSPTANINYVNSLNFEQHFTLIGDRYFYADKVQSASFRYATRHGSEAFFGALLVQSSHYSQLSLANDSVKMIPFTVPSDSLSPGFLQEKWDKIDSLNQGRIQMLAYSITDMIINGYAHIWKLDVGPLLNLFNYNKLEGARPMLSARTGERLWPNVTIGGYGGYGFGDHKWKYGGEVQWRFGANRGHTLGAFYDRRVYRYAFDNVTLYKENKVEQYDHLFNWIFSTNAFPFNFLNERATLRYRYEQYGVRATTELRWDRTYGNEYVPFIQQGVLEPYVTSASFWFDMRFSWKEQTLDNFFRRHYLRSKYPVLHVVTEGGFYQVGDEQNPYGRLQLILSQRLPFVYGKLLYTIDAAWVIGSVPFTKLYITRGSRGLYYSQSNYALLEQSEFCADKFIGGFFRYETSGILFNMIPYVNRLNIREDVMFNIGYGGLDVARHNPVLVIPTFMKGFKLPYMEVGCGVSNILNFITLDSFWRITYRDNAVGPLWGIKIRFDLNF